MRLGRGRACPCESRRKCRDPTRLPGSGNPGTDTSCAARRPAAVGRTWLCALDGAGSRAMALDKPHLRVAQHELGDRPHAGVESVRRRVATVWHPGTELVLKRGKRAHVMYFRLLVKR